MSNKNTLLGFVAGAALGALAGILLAPDKGSETRKKITDKTGDLADTVKSSFSDLVDHVKNLYNKAEDSADEAGQAAKAKVNKVKNEATTAAQNSFS